MEELSIYLKSSEFFTKRSNCRAGGEAEPAGNGLKIASIILDDGCNDNVKKTMIVEAIGRNIDIWVSFGYESPAI